MASARVWLVPVCRCVCRVSALAASFAGEPAATCSGLAGAAWRAVRIDSAAMQSPSHLLLSEHAPTPASRVSPANPAFCKVLGHIEPSDPKAPPIHFQVNLPPHGTTARCNMAAANFNGVLITGVGLPQATTPRQAASPLAKGFSHLRHRLRARNQTRQAAAIVCRPTGAFVNFAHASYKKVRDTAVMLIERAYGARPRRCISSAVRRVGAKA